METCLLHRTLGKTHFSDGKDCYIVRNHNCLNMWAPVHASKIRDSSTPILETTNQYQPVHPYLIPTQPHRTHLIHLIVVEANPALRLSRRSCAQLLLPRRIPRAPFCDTKANQGMTTSKKPRRTLCTHPREREGERERALLLSGHVTVAPLDFLDSRALAWVTSPS